MQDKDKTTEQAEADGSTPKPDDDAAPIDADDGALTDTDEGADTAAENAKIIDGEVVADDEATDATDATDATEGERERPHRSPLLVIVGILILAVIAGVVGAVLAPRLFPSETASMTEAVEQKIAGLEAEVAKITDLSTQVDKLQSDVASTTPATDVSSDLDDLKTRVSQLESNAVTGTAGTADLSTLEDQVKKLEASVAALTSAATQDSGSDGALTASVNTLQQQVDTTAQAVADLKDSLAKLNALPSEVTSLTTQVNELAGRSIDPKAAFVVAVGQLRDAASGSGSFEQQFTAASTVAPDDSDVKAALSKLEPLAATGAPSLVSLEADFGTTAAAVVAASEAQSGWIDQTLSSLEGLVSIRRVGSDVEGETPEAIVARAEASLQAGDLADAVSGVASLTGAPAEAAATWLAKAQDRLSVDEALTDLSSRASALVTGAAGAGN